MINNSSSVNRNSEQKGRKISLCSGSAEREKDKRKRSSFGAINIVVRIPYNDLYLDTFFTLCLHSSHMCSFLFLVNVGLIFSFLPTINNSLSFCSMTYDLQCTMGGCNKREVILHLIAVMTSAAEGSSLRFCWNIIGQWHGIYCLLKLSYYHCRLLKTPNHNSYPSSGGKTGWFGSIRCFTEIFKHYFVLFGIGIHTYSVLLSFIGANNLFAVKLKALGNVVLFSKEHLFALSKQALDYDL